PRPGRGRWRDPARAGRPGMAGACARRSHEDGWGEGDVSIHLTELAIGELQGEERVDGEAAPQEVAERDAVRHRYLEADRLRTQGHRAPEHLVKDWRQGIWVLGAYRSHPALGHERIADCVAVATKEEGLPGLGQPRNGGAVVEAGDAPVERRELDERAVPRGNALHLQGSADWAIRCRGWTDQAGDHRSRRHPGPGIGAQGPHVGGGHDHPDLAAILRE